MAQSRAASVCSQQKRLAPCLLFGPRLGILVRRPKFWRRRSCCGNHTLHLACLTHNGVARSCLSSILCWKKTLCFWLRRPSHPGLRESMGRLKSPRGCMCIGSPHTNTPCVSQSEPDRGTGTVGCGTRPHIPTMHVSDSGMGALHAVFRSLGRLCSLGVRRAWTRCCELQGRQTTTSDKAFMPISGDLF